MGYILYNYIYIYKRIYTTSVSHNSLTARWNCAGHLQAFSGLVLLDDPFPRCDQSGRCSKARDPLDGSPKLWWSQRRLKWRLTWTSNGIGKCCLLWYLKKLGNLCREMTHCLETMVAILPFLEMTRTRNQPGKLSQAAAACQNSWRHLWWPK